MSVQPGEVMPFRWDIGYEEENMVTDCDDAGSAGKLIENEVQCLFRIYNKGERNNEIEIGRHPCNLDDRNADDTLFDYFRGHELFSDTIAYADGKTWKKLPDDLSDFGEYKISLDEVKYKYCDADDSKEIKEATTIRVCQANFALTKPYMMQVGGSTTYTDVNLSDFYDMDGNKIIKSIDLDKVDTISFNAYN